MTDEEADDESVLDDTLFDAGEDGDDEGAYGLELDESQAQEVRQIFFATLPQYLEPVEQMVEQLFAAEEVDAEIRSALLTTVASIAQAAARIGVDELAETLDRLQDRLLLLEDVSGKPPVEMREGIERDLGVLRAATPGGDVGAEDAPRRPQSPTLFSVLKDVEDLDPSVLERLTAAGLVTVDQVAMAKPDEIAAVSGLSLAVVQRVIDALGLRAGGREAAPAGSLLDELHARLHARVEAEAALDETRASILRARIRAKELEATLEAAESRHAALRAALEEADARLTAGIDELARLRTRSAALEARRAVALGHERRLQPELQQLRTRYEDMLRQTERYRAELSALTSRVRSLSNTARRSLTRRSGGLAGGRDPPGSHS